MIGILSQGRLGNQMFQYAFIYAASKKLNTPFFMVNANSLHYFKLYKDLEKDNEKNIVWFVFRNLFRKSRVPISRKTIRTPFKWLKDWAIHKNIYTWYNSTNEENYLLSDTKNNTLYDGFFQSEDYYVHLKEEILHHFEIKPHYQQEFRESKKAVFNKPYIAIHIRRTDFLIFGGEEMGGTNVILPISYYQKCLDSIENIDRYNLVFISDDIDFVKNAFGHKDNYFYEKNSEIIDFQLLLNADVLIIANSTFSWWAAWLNQKAKKIYAPNYYLGFKIKKFYPTGIKVNTWEWVDAD